MFLWKLAKGYAYRSMLRTVSTVRHAISKTPAKTLTGLYQKAEEDQLTMECSLDQNRLKRYATQPYHFGTERSVLLKWTS